MIKNSCEAQSSIIDRNIWKGWDILQGSPTPNVIFSGYWVTKDTNSNPGFKNVILGGSGVDESISVSLKEATEDTICFPISAVKKVLTDARLYKLTDSLLHISERQLAELKSKVSLLEERDQEQKNFYTSQISNLERQIELLKEQVKGFEKLLRRERTKRRLITGAGIVTTGAAILLSLKK